MVSKSIHSPPIPLHPPPPTQAPTFSLQTSPTSAPSTTFTLLPAFPFHAPTTSSTLPFPPSPTQTTTPPNPTHPPSALLLISSPANLPSTHTPSGLNCFTIPSNPAPISLNGTTISFGTFPGNALHPALQSLASLLAATAGSESGCVARSGQWVKIKMLWVS